MVFPPSPVPAPDNQLVPDTTYAADKPFDLKQAAITHARRRWFDVADIGTVTPPYLVTPGLAAGATQRIQFDHRPDIVVVSILATAVTSSAHVFMGDPGGPPIRLGDGGYCIVPGPEAGVISITNTGSTLLYGTVIAMAGYLNLPDLMVFCGGSPGQLP